MRAKGCGCSEFDERKKQNFRRINVGDGEDWNKYILDRDLRDEDTIPHLISFDREAWAADLFQDSFSEFLLPLETEQKKKTEQCAISTAPFASTDISVMPMTASFPHTLAFSFQSPL
ncbi:uncharacterized protein MONOS_17194 [Monocercomonoides exilis]|uniref:uncharacterized protein n=1 Tax=Monocercomonoides exilis TaxID=2049356 RepID=UPI0035597C65|nr:hypothetical protein MONOS_17194 [Monocercomonoides exilis]